MDPLVGKGVKVAGRDIPNVPRVAIASLREIVRSGIYTMDHGALQYDFALFRRPGPARRLFVFFSGYVRRGQLPLPVFQRWSWHAQFPGHTLFFSDPTLKSSETLGLGWYIGTDRQDAGPHLVAIVRRVAALTGVSDGDVTFYGSSGGGFAALRAQALLPAASSIVINPQIVLTRFVGHSLRLYLDAFFGGISADAFARTFPERNSIAHLSPALARSRIVYAQNAADRHHVERHMAALLRPDPPSRCPADLRVVMFRDDAGHDVAEPPDLVPRLVALSQNGG